MLVSFGFFFLGSSLRTRLHECTWTQNQPRIGPNGLHGPGTSQELDLVVLHGLGFGLELELRVFMDWNRQVLSFFLGKV
jgi:hypothetical protein